MSELILHNSMYFLESDSVSMFPTAYRGYKISTTQNDTTTPFNLEAKLSTEFNFRHTSPIYSKEAYLIEHEYQAATSGQNEVNKYKCFIGGYYFELNLSGSTLLSTYHWLNVYIKSTDLINGDSDTKTQIIGSWNYTSTTNDKVYDKQLDTSNGTTYLFTGIKFTEEKEEIKEKTKPTDCVKIYNLDLSTTSDAHNLLPLETTDIESNKLGIKITGNLIDGAEEGSIRGIMSVASEKYSFAEGWGTIASKQYSHTEGYMTSTNGDAAHAEGKNTTASGFCSHAEGIQTEAGYIAHAEGAYSKAYYTGAHAEGLDTIANVSAQHAAGKYNIADTESTGTLLEIIGNGESAEGITTRANARILDTNGNESLSGYITVGRTMKSSVQNDGVTMKYDSSSDSLKFIFN